MKSIGIVRKIDRLDRIVIPKELCRTYGIGEGTPMEIFTDDNGEIILKKYQPLCAVCHESSDLVEWLAKYGIKVCRKCLAKAEE